MAFNALSGRWENIAHGSEVENDLKIWRITGSTRIIAAKLRFHVTETFIEDVESDTVALDTFRYTIQADVAGETAEEYLVYEYHPHVDDDDGQPEEAQTILRYGKLMHLHPYKTSGYPIKRLHFPCTFTYETREQTLFSLIDWVAVDLLQRFNDFTQYAL